MADWKKEEKMKIQKFKYLKEWKELFRWNKKTFFIVFEELSFGKNKNLIKDSGHKL